MELRESKSDAGLRFSPAARVGWPESTRLYLWASASHWGEASDSLADSYSWTDMVTMATQSHMCVHVLPDPAMAYAERLRANWPQAKVYREQPQTREDVLRIVVVAPKVDFGLEKDVYDLMWIPEAEQAHVLLDVAAYFEERCAPDLSGFRRIA